MTDPIAWPCAEVAGTIAGVGEMVTVFRPSPTPPVCRRQAAIPDCRS